MGAPTITEIKFACSHCGQRIGVESDAAGLSVECPTCRNEVTIPDGSAPPEPRRKDGGLREKLAAAHSECERLRANATHAQAEIKSFHNERLALRSEAASLKQRASDAEAGVAAMKMELDGVRGELAAAVAAIEQTQITAAVAEARAIETQKELAGISEKHAAALVEMDSLRALLDKDATSRELLATKSNLAATEEELRTRRQTAAELEAALLASETERQRLDDERSEMHRRVAAALKRAEDSTKEHIEADNAKLRELLERQSEELRARFKELKRFRHAKLALKIIWALAALSAIGLGYLFAHILPMIEWGR